MKKITLILTLLILLTSEIMAKKSENKNNMFEAYERNYSSYRSYKDMGSYNDSVVEAFLEVEGDYIRDKLNKENYIFENIYFNSTKKELGIPKNKLKKCEYVNVIGNKLNKCIVFENMNKMYERFKDYDQDGRRYKWETKFKKRDSIVYVSFKGKTTEINELFAIQNYFLNQPNVLLLNYNLYYNDIEYDSDLFEFGKKYKLTKDLKSIEKFRLFSETMERKILKSNNKAKMSFEYIEYNLNDNAYEFFKENNDYQVLSSELYIRKMKLEIKKINKNIHYQISFSFNNSLKYSRDRFLFIMDNENKVIKDYLEQRDLESNIMNNILKK